LIFSELRMARGYIGKLANPGKRPVRTDSSARFLRRPRIILMLNIFAVIGIIDFALWYWAEEPGGARVTPPIPRAGPAVAVRIAVTERPDVPTYAIGFRLLSPSASIPNSTASSKTCRRMDNCWSMPRPAFSRR
jgi:hypothetical protein